MNAADRPLAPLLVIGWGNPSRGDDALGPLFVERLRAAVDGPALAWLTDFQLQVEHALDLAGRARVLFVDASVRCAAPFEVSTVQPARDASFSTHAMSPAAVLQVLRDIGDGARAPACWLLAIRGQQFGLGEAPTAAALGHLEQALQWGKAWVQDGLQRGASGPAPQPLDVRPQPPAGASPPRGQATVLGRPGVSLRAPPCTN
jgi:hydrogenase maturation protease